ERPATPEDDRGRKDELHPSEERRGEGMLHWLAWEHLGHRQQQQRHCQDQTNPEPTGHVDQFRIRFLLQAYGTGFEGHPADGTRAWPILAHLGMHGTGIHPPRHRYTPVGIVSWRYILRWVSAKLL